MPDPVAFAAASSTVDALVLRAAELAVPGADRPAAAAELIGIAAGDRAALEQARNVYALRLHGRSDDWTATGALSLLNRAVTDAGWVDPFEWKHRRKP